MRSSFFSMKKMVPQRPATQAIETSRIWMTWPAARPVGHTDTGRNEREETEGDVSGHPLQSHSPPQQGAPENGPDVEHTDLIGGSTEGIGNHRWDERENE